MSLPPNVLCRTGCGDFGDPELDFLCGDCYGDKIEIEKQKALLEYIESKNKPKADASEDNDAVATNAESPSRRRGPPKIDHRKAFEAFLDRPREKDDMIVVRECLFMEREGQIRDTSKLQLRRYMIATDVDEPVDPKEWGRYQYGAPRDVPQNDVDQVTELAAQIRLFCHWRKRTLNRRIMTRKQLNDQKREADAKAQKALKKAQRKSAVAKLVPKLSRPSLSLKSLKKSASARVLSTAGAPEATVDAGEADTAKPEAK